MPRKANLFYYTYVLLSLKDGLHYIGYTNDLRKRFHEHQQGLVFSTKPRRPLELVYYEACRNREDAEQRERYLKSTTGRRFLAQRIRRFNKLNKIKIVFN